MTDLMKDLDELDQHAIEGLKTAQTDGEGVRLPFPAAYAWVINGDVKQKAQATSCPPLYFGGWAMDQESTGELVEAGVIPGYPKGWMSYTGASDRGEYQSIAGRTLSFAPIAKRTRWVTSDGKNYGGEFDRDKGFTRRHIQYLVQMWSEGAPWGYTVLTAKGYQAQYLLESIAAWDKAISAHRKALNATQIPVSGFVVTVGTVGNTPNFVAVGSTATSKITPVSALIPENLTAEQVAKRFVGKANLRANAEKLAEAAQWLTAWKEPARAAAPAADDGGEYQPVSSEF